MAAPVSRLEFVRAVWDECRLTSGVEQTLFARLTVEAAAPAACVLRLPIEFMHTNRLESVHGGVLSALVDIGGSLAVSTEGLFQTGVSVEIATSFLNPGGKLGETLEVRGALLRLGGTLAFTSVEIWNVERGELVARGSHTKHVQRARACERNVARELLQ